jgi:inosose dehydratase
VNLSIANAPCSWGVEFADDPRNPPWTQVLDDARAAGYRGMELGPVGFMPEDPAVLGPALAERGLTLVGGVVFHPFHDPDQWGDVLDAARRTCRALRAHGARRLVLIDSIATTRAPTAGRSDEAKRLDGVELDAFLDRIRTVAKLGSEEFGLEVTFHAHAAGYVEFEDELTRVIDRIAPEHLGVCLDTGHSLYAGFDPVAFYRRHADRISCIHLKDIDPRVRERVIRDRIGFYEACAARLFCNLGEGFVDLPALRQALEASGYRGWATVEQDCDPTGSNSPVDDARVNLAYLQSVGLA